jgi:hypothetical protein
MYLVLIVLICGQSLAQEPPEPEREDAVRLAVRTLAEKLGIEEEAIRLQSATKFTWRDAGLGCAGDGMRHDPAPTPGYRVVLRIDSLAYRVHVASGRAVVCGKPLEAEAPPTPPEKAGPDLAAIVEAARKDLAERLSVDVEGIDVVESRSIVWRDGSLGCPEPGMMYTEALQDGALVKLRYGSKVYSYHSGGSRGPFLCEPRSDQREPKAFR